MRFHNFSSKFQQIYIIIVFCDCICKSKNFQTVECISMISHFTQFFILISGWFLSFETTVWQQAVCFGLPWRAVRPGQYEKCQCDRNYLDIKMIEIGVSLMLLCLTLLFTVKFGSGHLITANKVYVLRLKESFLNLPVV